MDLFNQEDLRTLLENRQTPCVSLSMSTTRGPGQHDKARWKGVLRQAEARLQDHRVRQKLVDELLSPARRLLDDPAVYLEDLNPEARSYFINQRGAMAARLCDATGLVAEQRAEGLALVDEAGALTDVAMPAEGTDAHVTLLTAEYLAMDYRQQTDAASRRQPLAKREHDIVDLANWCIVALRDKTADALTCASPPGLRDGAGSESICQVAEDPLVRSRCSRQPSSAKHSESSD